ncbi:MAG: class I SAM-dependent methyltransferase [Rhodobacteraceae bacterium]|nr:class I SAM-dependent methyltransferase [Paracoccaceae bacterium]
MTAPVEYADELVPLKQAVDLTGLDLLDLGCGAGWLSRRMAGEGAASVTAIDTDADRITRNIAKDGTTVRFLTGAAERLPLQDASLDLIVMMKSLHHVPIAQMDVAFSEFARVLRPGGKMYICEPAYEGAFNEVLVPFHDEGPERAAALQAILCADGFDIIKEFDYLRPVDFTSIDDFRAKMMHLPWLKSRITPMVEAQVETAWKAHAAPDGSAAFKSRMIVFVLRKC